MKSFAVALSLAPVAFAAQANPIRKVVTLLQDMQKEILAEGKKEEELYEKFVCYCQGNNKDLLAATGAAEEEIERLASKLQAERAEKQTAEQELKEAKKDRADAKQDLAKATELRKKEKATYDAESGDTKDNIDATTAAIKALEKGSGAGFLQTEGRMVANLKRAVSMANTDAEDRQAVLAFISQSGDYVPQSGQIIGILKNMKDDMDKDLGGIVSTEEAAVKGFGELKAAKTKEIQALTDAIESKMQRIGQLAVSIVQAQNGHDDAQSEVENNKKFLVNLKATCAEKAKDMEERTKIRQDEVLAISEAISVLNDDDALDIFKSTLPSPKAPAPQAFLQTRSRVNVAQKAIQVLASNMLNSKNAALALLSSAAISKLKEGSKVDFSTVVKMIDDMVSLLNQEQKDDEKHKNWCDQEFDSSDDEKKALTQKVASLVSSISELRDEIKQVASEIAEAQARVVALDKSVAEASEQRKEEHAEFSNTVQMNEAAIQLIFKAKNRLNKFYNPAQHVKQERVLTEEERLVKAAGGEIDPLAPQYIAGTTQTVFVQVHRQSSTDAGAPPPPPETFGAYQKKGQKSNSIMALMDMLTKELESDIQAAEHEEKTAKRDYEELVADAQESRSQESKTITTQEGNKANLEGVLEDAKRENIIKSDQLAQTNSYIADLHNSCDFIVNNFEVRREARTKEVEGLKRAKAVLNGADYQ